MRLHRPAALALAGALFVATPVPAAAHSDGGEAPATAENFAKLRECESGGNYAADTGNGYYGAYQFSRSTWQSLGYRGYPHHNPPEVQDEAAWRLQDAEGWDPWPYCADRLGLR
ncbi:MAG: transglycosylase family protein [Actinomycetota bacterium]|nr:transglycosylase family protein [Actinomycetota bacterium]